MSSASSVTRSISRNITCLTNRSGSNSTRSFSSSSSSLSSFSSSSPSSSSPSLLSLTSSSSLHRSNSRRSFSASSTANDAVAAVDSATSKSDSSNSSNLPRNRLPPLARSNPKLYISLLKPKPTAISTLASRIGLLPSSVDSKTAQRRLALVEQACTHHSLTSLWQSTFKNPNQLSTVHLDDSITSSPSSSILDSETRPKHNSSLSLIGNSLLGLVGTEYLHSKYPHLPTRVLKAALSAHVGPSTCSDVATEMGLSSESGMLRWDRDATVDRKDSTGIVKKSLLSSEVSSTAMRALVAVIFQELGLPSVRIFIQNRFLSRLPTTLTSNNPTANQLSSSNRHSRPLSIPSTPSSSSLSSFLKFNNPKRVLSSTCEKYGKERPQSRLLAETGRLSNSPVFVVGVFSGQVKLGEGNGSSIRMAEFRAAEDALRRLYLTSVPSDLYPLPSTTLDSMLSPNSIFSNQNSSTEFRPQPLGESEVVYSSKSS